MAFARVALRFAELPDSDLDEFANQVFMGMTGNANFPTPPVALVDLNAHEVDYKDKVAEAAMGGPMATAVKNDARQLIIGDLRQLAIYVEGESNGDLTKLLSSGFQARSTERQSLPLETPTELAVTNDGDGALNASVKPVKNCAMYEGRAKPDGGDWMDSVFSGASRHIRFTGLTPGAMYTIQVRGLGGSTGTSDWSDPAMHRSL